MNASVVRIRSLEENDFIAANFPHITTWLGAKREIGNQWKWLDGRDVIYTNWKDGEPNNLETEECLLFCNRRGNTGVWIDYPSMKR
ncbi:C-type lectin domain family 4 member E-like protein [Leptotrombidium deliense]|uniref:C-type lectin domain family 4 member E-like protein n=1 Tax=Leptotrombidium deliense TaxID=299467 RepID=A0A443RT18_9ACAR|nr:C-type lectin domain family 4 member E-like protein [Leptotrombidium deliense]